MNHNRTLIIFAALLITSILCAFFAVQVHLFRAVANEISALEPPTVVGPSAEPEQETAEPVRAVPATKPSAPVRDAQPVVQQVEPRQQRPAPVQPVEAAYPYVGVLEVVNEYRKSMGRAPLRMDDQLVRSAQLKASHMVEFNYWAHTSPSGVTPWSFFKQVGYAYDDAGENLARCFVTPAGVVNGWINSPTHEAILIGDYGDVGFASAYNEADGCRYVVGHFGIR